MNNDARSSRPAMPSLLDAEEAADQARRDAKSTPAASRRSGFLRGPRAARAGRFIGAALALSGVLAGAAIAWSSLRPINPPDAFEDPFDNVLGFALLDEDFNKLPLEERLELIKQIAERFGSLSSSDSAVMAAFAAGIKDEARRQLEENTRTLMVDMMDKFATDYAKRLNDDPEAAIEDSMLEMIGLMQDLRMAVGDEPSRTPAETLERIKSQSRAEADRNREASTSLDGEGVAEAFDWVQSDVNQFSSPGERARVTRFMRDTTRYLQGRDVRTGRPKRN